MARARDEAMALNEDLERMRREVRAVGADLKKIAAALRAAEGRGAEPDRLEPLTRVIAVGPRPVGPVAAWDPGDRRPRSDERPRVLAPR
jgi:hypothetical protein